MKSGKSKGHLPLFHDFIFCRLVIKGVKSKFATDHVINVRHLIMHDIRQRAGLHLESGARGCKIVVLEIRGGGGVKLRLCAHGNVSSKRSGGGGESSPRGANTPSRPPLNAAPKSMIDNLSYLIAVWNEV